MSGLTLAFVAGAALVTTGQAPYGEARKEALETGRPLVVLVSADWCTYCQVMKRSVMPELEERGTLKQVSYAVLDRDAQPGLAGKMMQGGPIPQLVMYWKTPEGWQRSRLIGRQSAEEVERFLKRGVDEAVIKTVSVRAEDRAQVLRRAELEETPARKRR